jgi:hypothetical protein
MKKKIDSEPELKDHLELINKASRESGSAIVTALVPINVNEGVHTVRLDLDSFLQLLSECRPRVVYIQIGEFESEENLRSVLDVEMADEDPVSESALFKTLVKRWAKFNGEIDQYAASFMIDGVLHVVFTQTNWFDEFETAAEELTHSLGEQKFRAAEQKQMAERVRLAASVKQLNEHPVFHAGRPSFEKKKYLAKKLFPNAEEEEIRVIVDEATNENWLRVAGYYSTGND